MGLFSDKRPFVKVKIPVLPQTDVYLALFHVPAPIILLYSHERLCIYSLLLLLRFPMTRLSEEAVVPCFQLTLRRISEPKSSRLSRRLLLRLSAALASNLPHVWFKYSIPAPRDRFRKLNVAFLLQECVSFIFL